MSRCIFRLKLLTCQSLKSFFLKKRIHVFLRFSTLKKFFQKIYIHIHIYFDSLFQKYIGKRICVYIYIEDSKVTVHAYIRSWHRAWRRTQKRGARPLTRQDFFSFIFIGPALDVSIAHIMRSATPPHTHTKPPTRTHAIDTSSVRVRVIHSVRVCVHVDVYILMSR